MLATTIPLVRDTGLILMEAFPRTIGYSQVFATLSDLPGVQHVHSLHVWSLTAGTHALAVHLALGKKYLHACLCRLFLFFFLSDFMVLSPPTDSTTNRDIVTARAQYLLRTKFGINFSTIQTESFDHSTMNSCFQCKSPVNWASTCDPPWITSAYFVCVG